MNKLIIQHTNRLVRCATKVAQDNNIKVIPFPKNHFKSSKCLDNYLNNLTNFIERPELYYLSKNSNVNIEQLNNIKIPNKYFKFIKN
jgi:hypothetical protein